MAFDWKNDPSNPAAIPVYNDNILKFWNWFDTVWSCADWMNWHKSMVKAYGLTKANSTFLKYWDDLATGSSAIDCRTFNAEFRTYTKKVGLFDSLYSGLGVIAKPIGAAGDVVGSASGAISSAAKGAENTAKVVSFLLPLVVIIAVVFAIIYFGKKYKVAK